ncbi:MAG: glycosyltransferase, partial [Leptospiraceae bacterium]|nr:glycosyltransferase [Leptospiraceae bacterium]
MTRPIVSVIIPSYNEVENVPILIERLVKLLSDVPHEIIVVDDNSPDGTWEVAEKMAERTPGLRVIRRLNERGLSSAVVTGMSAAAGETLAVMDADLQHDENVLPEMVRTLMDDGYDIAIGSRGVTGGSYGEFSKRRRFISWVAATMAR